MAKKNTKKEITPPVAPIGRNGKKKAPDPAPPATDSTKSKGKNSKGSEPQSEKPVNVMKRPSSGKTPISLLHEHAQKTKWDRVEYDMHRVKDGFVSTALLAWTDPRTKEKIIVKCPHKLPAVETSIEARYYAATVSLHRVCFNKSLHMVLPREFKDAWAVLEDERKVMLKENPTKHNRIYNNDPFRVVLEDRKVKNSRQKEEQVRLNNEAKTKRVPTVLTSVKQSINTASQDQKRQVTKRPALAALVERHVKFPKKVWESALSFKFSIKQRDMIQQSIRHHITWKLASQAHPESMEKMLFSIGFRKSHIEEALRFQDPLSYLLFNVPDDDLPPYFSNPSAFDSVTVADKNEIILKKVTAFGVSRSEAIVALNDNDIDATKSIVALTCKYADFVQDPSQTGVDSQEIWDEEIQSLSMIYDPSQIIKLNDTSVQIKLNDVLQITVYKPDCYPYHLAGFVISTIDSNVKIPNYVKLKIITKLAEYTIQNLIGDSYIFSIVDWLQQNVDGIIENPGRLLESPKTLAEGVDDLDIISANGKGRRMFRSNPDTQFIKEDYLRRSQSKALSEMHKSRATLPAWKERDNLMQVINSHRISLITGETGSGKSTQLVQFILDDLYAKGNFKTQIMCTQPRRISAIGLAERVADERVTKCGEEVGYIIRGANKSNKNTRIKFLTTGILVKFLQNGDEFLNDSILVLDEVHERSMETDLIIIMIKRLLSKYKNLKIVLMSATVDTNVFKSYFPEIDTAHIKGRTFPIEDFYLDDVLNKTEFKIRINDEWIQPKSDSNFFASGRVNYDLVAELVIKIDEDLERAGNKGSILIFLPGVAEIASCIKTIQQKFGKASVILPLHSALTPQDQHRVFATYPSKRKIIVSTNIAETSITINDCVVTIDSGKVKSMTYNAIDNTTRLVETFESKAEAKQRRGRAGRVSAGVSYKLYTKETYESMMDAPIPEIKRINLNSLYLVVKTIGIKDVIGFLNSGIDPPPRDSLLKSEELLKCSRLIDEYDELTELGKFVSLLPIIDPKHGILLIYSIIFGCTDFGILIASVLGAGSPFIHSQENRDKIKNILLENRGVGDLISSVLIVERYFNLQTSGEKKKYVQDNFLSYTKLTEIKSARAQYVSILEDIGFIPLKYKSGDVNLNRNGKNISVIRSIVTGAFYPQVARVQLPDPKFLNTGSGSVQADHDAKMIKYWIRNEQYMTQVNRSDDEGDIAVSELPATRAFIHPSSVLFDTSNREFSQSQIQELELEEKGSEAFAKLQQREVELTPKASGSKSKALTSSFVVYNSSTITSKLFLRDITPTSTLSTLLFGGNLTYDLSSVAVGKQSPGIVLDSWLPVRTWSKNAVLIKELRTLVDRAVKSKLENPSYGGDCTANESDDVLALVDALLASEHT